MNPFGRAHIFAGLGILTALLLAPLLFLTLPGIEPKGIVLERYATDEVMGPPRGGPDRLMVSCDARSLCDWIVRHIQAVAGGRAIPQQ